MSDHMKEIMSLFAAFISGFGAAYFAKPEPSAWPGWVVAGAVSLGAYVGGYSQTNPRNQPKTPEALLAAVKKSDIPVSVKAEIAAPLAAEAAKPEKTEKTGKA